MNFISDWLNPVPVPCDPPATGSTKRDPDRSASSGDPELKSTSREATLKREDKISPEGRKESSRPKETSSMREEDPSRSRRTAGTTGERTVRSGHTEPPTSSSGERTTRLGSSANAERLSSKNEVRASSAREETSRSTSESISGSSDGVGEGRSSSQSATKQPSAEKTSRSEVVTSEAIKKASGSTTVTKSNGPGEDNVNNVRVSVFYYSHLVADRYSDWIWDALYPHVGWRKPRARYQQHPLSRDRSSTHDHVKSRISQLRLARQHRSIDACISSTCVRSTSHPNVQQQALLAHTPKPFDSLA